MTDLSDILIISPCNLSLKGNENYAWKYMCASEILHEMSTMYKKYILALDSIERVQDQLICPLIINFKVTSIYWLFLGPVLNH